MRPLFYEEMKNLSSQQNNPDYKQKINTPYAKFQGFLEGWTEKDVENEKPIIQEPKDNKETLRLFWKFMDFVKSWSQSDIKDEKMEFKDGHYLEKAKVLFEEYQNGYKQGFEKHLNREFYPNRGATLNNILPTLESVISLSAALCTENIFHEYFKVYSDVLDGKRSLLSVGQGTQGKG